MQNTNNYFYPQLPPKLKNKWHITDIITNSGNSQIYIINCNTKTGITDNKRILKIIHKTQFQKKIYKIISYIESSYIQKPIEIIYYKNNYYIITKYQLNLNTIISQKGITQNDILDIASDISSSLELLHSKKILHLDCTPSNIYINDNGSYCLGDFSSAVFIKNINTTLNFTPGYIPPEISNKEPLSYLSDEYIFSCLLYTLFNNGYTYNNNNMYNNIKNNIPENLYSIIIKGCSNNPSDRFSSISEINNKLNSIPVIESLSAYNYNLQINDPFHPVYYLKTSLINIKPCPVYKKQFKTFLFYGSLLIITGCIFVFSLFNYLYKNTIFTKNNQAFENTEDIQDIEEFGNYISNKYNNKNNNEAKISKNNNKTNLENEAELSNTNLFSVPHPQSSNFSCDKLTILYANVNKIDNLENIIHYTSLKELYLSDNMITSVLPLEELDNLEILVLSYNKITDLSPLCTLTKLTHLDLSGNKNMYNFNELVTLYNLKTLNVTNTNITNDEVSFLSSKIPGCKIFY